MITSFVRGNFVIVLAQSHASKESGGTIYFLNRNFQLMSGLVIRSYKKGLPVKRVLWFSEMVQSFNLNFFSFIYIILCIHLFLTDARRTNSLFKKSQRRQSISIGQYPGETNTRRQGRPGQNGDVYEFHRFQHYGFKTPAPNTFSLESMLAFLAPLATLPIIASAALSSMAAILPTLTTEGDKFNKKKAGKDRKRCTISVYDRKTKILCFRDKRISWSSMRSDLSVAGVSVSLKTITGKLADVRLKGRIPRKKPYLNLQQHLRRPQWAMEHINWTNDY
ncbi:uncharacterized protein TNCV_4813731 [Trichonephila clavipes]|nr:uncharacterized protein TNCV_4813731 [Trichonephila clavipes]